MPGRPAIRPTDKESITLNGTNSPGRHEAPEVGHDPATCPMCLHAGYIADHGLRHFPAETHADIRAARIAASEVA